MLIHGANFANFIDIDESIRARQTSALTMKMLAQRGAERCRLCVSGGSFSEPGVLIRRR
jgi:hypothetical protein